MKTLQIAFRNIFRNRRRSLMTVLAIAISGVAILLFGGFIAGIIYSFQTGIIQSSGHLHLYQKDFFRYGTGNPAAYGIADYPRVLALLEQDPDLKSYIRVATPILKVYGIAGNFAENASKTFFSTGMIPSNHEKMSAWNDYGLRHIRQRRIGLTDTDIEGGEIGFGVARMLQLCDELKVPDCQDKPVADAPAPTGELAELSELAAQDIPPPSKAEQRPKLDLLAATPNGAPNAVTLYVNRVENQGLKEIDDYFIAMHLQLAQKLLYGRGEKKVTGIVLQLHHTADMPTVKTRLKELFAKQRLDLEVIDFQELLPMYPRVITLFDTIFIFIAAVMGMIVLFTIINTMSMSVMERINEIGTIRALGVRRSGIKRQFLVEGGLLGIFGATLGLLAALGLTLVINTIQIMWTPPNSAQAVPLTLLLVENIWFLPQTWFALVGLTVLSSLLPARKAARMIIVDALRHV